MREAGGDERWLRPRRWTAAAKAGRTALWRRAELSLQPKPGMDAGADRGGAHWQAATCACRVLLIRRAQAPRKWITDPTLACGGPIADVGVHCIDALRFVLGEDVRSVSTVARKDEASGKVEAIASLQLEMTGGVYANVTASARAPYRTLVEVNGQRRRTDRREWLDRDRPVQLVLRRGGRVG